MRFVNVFEADGQQVRAGIRDFITGASALLEILFGAGEEVWVEHRSIKGTKMKATLDKLDSLKWNPIAMIEAV